MPKRVAIGKVVSDQTSKFRRVEIPRLVKHPKYGKILHRKTVCHVHDEQDTSHAGDTVEIQECPPKSRLKRWELVRVVSKSKTVDLAALKTLDKGEKVTKGEKVGKGEKVAKGEKQDHPA